MKKSYYAKGLTTLARYGGLIFCENCKSVLGSINSKGYRYINLNISCKCNDNLGSLEIATSESTSNPYESVNRMPKMERDIATCKRCGTPLFGVIDERVKGYSFYVECTCGEKYDLKSAFPKRLGETLEIIKKGGNE